MSIAGMTLTEQGHLFGVWTGVGPEWCLGCACRTDSVRAAEPCPEGEEMAADIEAQAWADSLRSPSV